jgi:uncharacterized protein YcaQ
MINELQTEDRLIFEYWGHAASYLPMSDYRFYQPLMHSFNNPGGKWEREKLEKCGHLLKPVLERIRREGPLSSSDFSTEKGEERGPWWNWKPAKIALEMLFWRGDLMITERRNFQRVYDLKERVLPAGLDKRMPDDDELGEFLVFRALSAYGVAQEREIHEHIHSTSKKIISKSLDDLVNAGKVITLRVEREKSAYFALPETIEKAARFRQSSPHLHLLSPFDNLIIQRRRTERLFGFHYTLECYTPAAKRKYGYYALPILWDGNFVGRIDPKAERRNKVFVIRNLLLESHFGNLDDFLPSLAKKVVDLILFNQCETVKLENISPARARRPLTHCIKQTLAHSS